jgi:uncharacterized protein YprB with RNaseH-like and TPR domain
MNIKKRLENYKSAAPGEKKEKKKISPSVSALKEHFNAVLSSDETPFIFIEKKKVLDPQLKSILIKNKLNFQLLSKNQIGKINAEECLFFDLETTGLMGGTGTFAFLMGFGFFKEDIFYVHQYFLPDYGIEYQLFERLQELYGSKKVLVSYNGKSFDLPLLNTRFTMNRFPKIFSEMQHLDLLHLARRLWKNSYPACNLNTIEENILNRYRENDIPGAFIPQAYFDFLNSGRVNEIIQIIEHNYFDILSLGELFLIIGNIEDDFCDINDEKVLLQIAQLAYEQKSMQLYRLNDKLKESEDYIYLLACDYKRRRNGEKAESYWQFLSSTKKYHFIALEELAKYYEHITKNYHKALEYAEKASAHLQTIGELKADFAMESTFYSFQRRIMRLKKKIS